MFDLEYAYDARSYECERSLMQRMIRHWEFSASEGTFTHKRALFIKPRLSTNNLKVLVKVQFDQ